MVDNTVMGVLRTQAPIKSHHRLGAMPRTRTTQDDTSFTRQPNRASMASQGQSPAAPVHTHHHSGLQPTPTRNCGTIGNDSTFSYIDAGERPNMPDQSTVAAPLGWTAHHPRRNRRPGTAARPKVPAAPVLASFPATQPTFGAG